jgi:hypothetical protein
VCVLFAVFLTGAYSLYASAQTITVATCDSQPSSKAKADFKTNCSNDQKVINQALAACPAAGCSVMLYEGHYDIRAVSGTLGGILITRSNVHLYGVGAATQLRLADNQNKNVIRVIGDGLRNITISDLSIDGNFTKNGNEAPGLEFEICGVRASTSTSNPLQNITVERTVIKNNYRLNVYLWGTNVKIRNNILGDARSDSAECITGPCEISGNYVEIADRSGYGLGSDSADTVTITGNIVRVLGTGSIEQAVFRTWGGRYRNIISNNQVIVDQGGVVNSVLVTSGYMNIIQGNVFYTQAVPRSISTINGASVITGNLFYSNDLSFIDTTGLGWETLVDNNQFLYSNIVGTKPPNLLVGSNNVFHQSP